MSEINEQDIELIERVLSDTASGEEKDIFEEKKTQDPEFAARVLMLSTIKNNANIDSDGFESLLDEIHDEMDHHIESPVIAKTSRNWYYIAATIVLLISAIFVFRGFLQPQSMGSIYASNFSIPPENITTRNGDQIDQYLAQAIEAYSSENYRDAVDFFNDYLSEDPQDPGANFYMGISLLLSDQTEEAITTFNNIINRGDSIYYNAAYWYLGLSYLKLENKEKAVETFTKISASSSSYAVKAEKILKTIVSDD